MINVNDSEKLIFKIAEGDTIAFSKFYHLYYPKIFRISQYFINTVDGCKEVVSEVFYNLWISRRSLVSIENLDGYLYTSIKNQSVKYKKRQFQYDLLEDISADLMVETNSPDKEMISDELREQITKAVNELPPRCRAIFTLIREDGLKYKEVAQLLSISEKTIQAQMIIATKKIIQVIIKLNPDLPPGRAFTLFLLFFKKKKESV